MSTLSNLIMIVSAFVVPVLVAVTITKKWLAVLLSAIVLSTVTHLASWFSAGYVDPFFIISIPISVIVFAVWSWLLVWIVHQSRSSESTERPPANNP